MGNTKRKTQPKSVLQSPRDQYYICFFSSHKKSGRGPQKLLLALNCKTSGLRVVNFSFACFDVDNVEIHQFSIAWHVEALVAQVSPSGGFPWPFFLLGWQWKLLPSKVIIHVIRISASLNCSFPRNCGCNAFKVLQAEGSVVASACSFSWLIIFSNWNPLQFPWIHCVDKGKVNFTFPFVVAHHLFPFLWLVTFPFSDSPPFPLRGSPPFPLGSWSPFPFPFFYRPSPFLCPSCP